MAIQISNDLITVADAQITAQSTASGYAKKNVFILDNLMRRWRMDSAGTSNTNPIMYFDMLSAQTIEAVVLDRVNFNKVQILGHASDLSTNWTAASFDSGVITISRDAQVDRYKVIIPLTAFNYRYLAIVVPTTASAVGSYTAKWEISRVGLLDSIYTFTHDMAPGYERGNEQGLLDLELPSRRRNRRDMGEHFWVGVLHFGTRTTTQEVDLTTLNCYDMSDELVYYRNNNNTSQVYFVMRDDSYIGTVEKDGVVTGSSIRLQEMA